MILIILTVVIICISLNIKGQSTGYSDNDYRE